MTKRVLDEKTKLALQGLAPFSSLSTVWFTPDFYVKTQIEKDFTPAFKIRGLSMDESRSLDELLKDAGQGKTDNFNDNAYDAVRKVLVGWENVFDAGSGEEIPFVGDSGGCSVETFALLPVNVKAAFLMFVLKMHGLVDTAKLGLP